MPVFERPSGDILYVGYNRETVTLDVGQATNAGLAVQHSFPFDHDTTLETNLQSAVSYTHLLRVTGVLNTVILSEAASQNFERGMSEQRAQSENLKR